MNITIAPGIFQQNVNHHKKKANTQNPLNDKLKQIVDRSMDKRNIKNETEIEFEAKKSNFDSYEKNEETDIPEQLDPDVLAYYRGLLKLYAANSKNLERGLSTFREQLLNYDQDIETYQGILNGDTDLPDGYSTEDITNLLTKTQNDRDNFIKESCDNLNQMGLDKPGSRFSFVNKLFGDDEFANKKESEWRLDSNADDIYAEIDRMLNLAKSYSQTLHTAIDKINDIMDKKGYSNDNYYQRGYRNYTAF